MRTAKHFDAKRNDILNIAGQLFMTKGYEETSTRDILKACDIAKGTLYHYFKSKEEILDALVEQFTGVLAQQASDIANRNDLSATQKLFLIVLGDKQTDGKEKMIETLHQVENAKLHIKSIVETIKLLTPILTKVVEAGIEEGVFHTPYPQEVVEQLIVSASFIFDDDIFSWTYEEASKKAVAFIHTMEVLLGAKPGSLSHMSEAISYGGTTFEEV